MQDELTSAVEPQDAGADLELGMQELEEMEAPGFWSGFKTGIPISTAVIASAAIAT
ncbi:daptide-type RiPP [Actinoplanes subglobosus]|uniref:Daptide-type RiPP n=1 Tax=Actinoplanes subglobosus TaxID=1547892 RepID=A0ABV8IVQ3_9ACTN